MPEIKQLLVNNKLWSIEKTAKDPGFFRKLAAQQAPEYLWIGCSDSRVPANDVVGLMPGELFVHRNVGNLVKHTDMNCLTVLQYAVEVLKVKHIVVCGHYGCGGVRAATENKEHGLVDNWVHSIRDLYQVHRQQLDPITDEKIKIDLLCELNVIEQVENICQTTIVQKAWRDGQKLSVHGFIYDIKDGIIKDLKVVLDNQSQLSSVYRVTA